ncbi:MAG: alpha/beta fold hydrolase, partial [Chitinophagales bacterium]
MRSFDLTEARVVAEIKQYLNSRGGAIHLMLQRKTKVFGILLTLAILLTIIPMGPQCLAAARPVTNQPNNQTVIAFSDLQGHWAEKEILALTHNGIVTDPEQDSLLEPGQPISRAEFVRLVLDNTVEASKLQPEIEAVNKYAFTDSSSDLNGRYLEVARQHHIIAGFSDGKARPNQELDRAEMAAIVMKAWNYPGLSDAVQFKDLPTKNWANTYINTLSQMKLLNGYGDGTFRPYQSATRAEALVTVKKCLEKQKYDYYMQLVETLDIKTDRDDAVFYSGPGNRALAEKYAQESGDETLEMTPGGKFLDDQVLFDQYSLLTANEAVGIWSVLSHRYAEASSGTVHCFVTGARPTGVFTTIELPELLKNKAVKRIVKADNTGYIKVNGGNVWYKIVGADKPGVPVLVLHGGPGCPSISLQALEGLADERPVILYDQLGCGNSDRPIDNSLWTVERYVEEVGQVREALGLDKVHIVGASWGSMLGAEYMFTKPEGVVSLVFSGPALSAERFAAGARSYIPELPKN